MAAMLTRESKELIEKELRRGTSKSRIAALLQLDFEEAQTLIEKVKKSVRPHINDKITFEFRSNHMTGTIIKLLTNSAVVKINWEESEKTMKDICMEKTIVNFKDIIDFV